MYQPMKFEGFWPKIANIAITLGVWAFLAHRWLYPVKGVVLAEPISTGMLLAILGSGALAGAGSIGGALIGGRKKETTTRPSPDPRFATSQIQAIESSLGGSPDFSKFLQGPGKSLSEAIARIQSAPVLRQAGRASGQRRETARRLGTLRTGGFTRREHMANVDLQGTLSGISDRAFRTLPQVFQQTVANPFQQRMRAVLSLLGIQSGQGPTTTTSSGGGAGPAVAAGGEAAGDIGSLLVMLEALKRMPQ